MLGPSFTEGSVNPAAELVADDLLEELSCCKRGKLHGLSPTLFYSEAFAIHSIQCNLCIRLLFGANKARAVIMSHGWYFQYPFDFVFMDDSGVILLCLR